MGSVINKLVRMLTVVCAVITIVSGCLEYLLPMYLLQKYKAVVDEGSSIGIIGGADGPTAIYISGYPSFRFFTLLFAAITLCGIIYQVYRKANKGAMK